MNKITIITLGVKNMARAIGFYRDGLGFRTNESGDNPDIVFFSNSGTKLALYPLELLAKDINSDNPPSAISGFSGITLAYNTKSKAEVAEVIELVRKAGATIVKEPQEVFWGGFHGYFMDLDGYCWEVAWNPEAKFDESGMVII